MNTKKILQSPIYFKHYKNKPYKLIAEAKHSEDLSDYIVYECLYPNETAQVWIRPKKVFNEIGSFNNKQQPRFKACDLRFEFFNEISADIETAIFALCEKNFEKFSAEKFYQRLQHKDQVLLICVFDGDKLIGFKIGYELDILRYYSWLGAVDENYRGLGIAKILMHEQHQWALHKKYKYIETKSENRFKAMIALNIFSGFEIVGTETSTRGQIKILFRKKLNNS